MVFQELVSSRSLDWVSCHTSGRGGEGEGERGRGGLLVGVTSYKNQSLRHSWKLSDICRI